jgi:hypothetical protein
MRIVIEPQHGHELDRLVTALLNATGVVHRAIEDTAFPPEPVRNAERRGRDSNPRWTVRPTTVFETAPFNRSGTPPSIAKASQAR